MFSDLKYALRQFAKNPGFTAVVVFILALGIGANSAIFAIVDAVLLSSLPVRDPQELAFLTDPNFHGMSVGGGSGVRGGLTYDEFRYLHDHVTAFSGLLAVDAQVHRFASSIDEAGRSRSAGRPVISLVSGSYFNVLGVRPAIGRTFGEEVDQPRDAHPVAVISDAYWQSQLGGAPQALGQKIRIQGTLYDVIGVAEPGFKGETFGAPVDVWIPITMQHELLPPDDYLSVEKNPFAKRMWLGVIGRRKSGVGLKQAGADANRVFQQYLTAQLPEVPADKAHDFLDQPLSLTDGARGGSTLRQNWDEPLVVLTLLVGLLLLVACANVANLLLARAIFRQREIAIRAAVGANAGRIFRQLLTESLLLSLIGGALGLLVARWGALALLYVAGGHNLALHSDGRVLGFNFAVSVLVGVLFGVAPAFRAARVDLNSVLKGTGVAGQERSRFSSGRLFVVIQVSLSLLLLVVAGLFIRSLQKLAVANLGYDRSHLLTFQISRRGVGLPQTGAEAFYEKLTGRLGAVPGVRGVSYSMLGLLGGGEADSPVAIEGRVAGRGQDMDARFDVVGPDYFTSLGTPVLLGRQITAEDERGGQHVGLINQTMARYYFGETNPIGRRIQIADDALGRPYPSFIVVGVVGDAKQHNAKETTLRRFYLPYFASPYGAPDDAQFVVRSVGNPAAVMAAIRSAVQEMFPGSSNLTNIRTIEQIAEGQLAVDRLLTKLSGFFGILAALLAATGIYGLLSYAVARRSREVGIRMALGAKQRDVLTLILGEAMLLVALGVGTGALAAIAAQKLIGSLLFGLGWGDPIVLAVTALSMFAIALAAAFGPAWRASRVSPAIVLRAE